MKKMLLSLLFFGLLGTSALQAKQTAETHDVRYATAADGSHMHFGIWTDCIIGTIVGNSPDIGHQGIMFPDGTFYDQSNRYRKKSGHFINEYSWGRVISWDHKQVIEYK